jgi:hypothetical protein
MDILDSGIIAVTISAATAGVSRTGFGVPNVFTGELPIGTAYDGGVLINSYTSLTALSENWPSTTDVHALVEKMFSQSVRPKTVKVSVRGTTVSRVMTLTYNYTASNFVTGNSITGVVNGVTVGPVVFDTDNAGTLSDIATAIQANEAVLTAVSNGVNLITVTFELEWDGTLSGFSVTGGAGQPTVTIATTIAGNTIREDIAAVLLQDTAWYNLHHVSTNKGLTLATAESVAALRKMHFYNTSEAGVYSSISTTDVMARLASSAFKRSMGLYHPDDADYSAAAWAGRLLPVNPGKIIAAYKTLTGVAVTTVTPSQSAVIRGEDKQGNTYEEIGGVNVTRDGITHGGINSYWDTIRDVDYLQARIAENVFSAFINTDKIPYTDGGIGIIAAKLSGTLGQMVLDGVLANDPAPQVFAPSALDVSADDRLIRLLNMNNNENGVAFKARLAGAIQTVDIIGVVAP